MKSFGSNGTVNTDDNLYLEFSSPLSVGRNVMMANASALSQYRENILPYLQPAMGRKEREEQRKKWAINAETAAVTDRAHALFLGGLVETKDFQQWLTSRDRTYPSFAPGRFIKEQYEDQQSQIPTLLQSTPLALFNDKGERVVIEISAVMVRISGERAAVMFVNNVAKIIYGQRYFSGPDLDGRSQKFAHDVLADVEAVYRRDTQRARGQGKEFPSIRPTMDRIKHGIEEKTGID
jgi:spermidine synthase